MEFNEDNLPAIYKDASRASQGAQRKYLLIIKFNLTLLIFGALLVSYSFTQDTTRITAWISAILLIAGLFLSLLLLKYRYEKIWYGARAVAESIKTISWKYMTCAEPFNCNNSDADAKFISQLTKIVEDRRDLAWSFSGNFATGDQITAQMYEFRDLSINDKKDIYLRYRVSNQREWYGNKSKYNSKRSEVYYLMIVSFQLLAIIASATLILKPDSPLRMTGVFSSLAAAFMIWMQLRQYQELAQAYRIAAHELGLIEVIAKNINTENELSNFVSDSENAISREHTLWIARRDRV